MTHPTHLRIRAIAEANPDAFCCDAEHGHRASCPKVRDGTLLTTSHRACGGRGCDTCERTGDAIVARKNERRRT